MLSTLCVNQRDFWVSELEIFMSSDTELLEIEWEKWDKEKNLKLAQQDFTVYKLELPRKYLKLPMPISPLESLFMTWGLRFF